MTEQTPNKSQNKTNSKSNPKTLEDLGIKPIFSKQYIDYVRQTKQMKYMDVEKAVYTSNVPLEYFTGSDENGDYVALVLGGRSPIFKGYVILLSPEVWKKLPKYRWCGAIHSSYTTFFIKAKVLDKDCYLSQKIAKIIGVSSNIYCLNHPMDYRTSSLTTSSICKLKKNGSMGFSEKVGGSFQARLSFSGRGRGIYLDNSATKTVAQQIYNTALLEWKTEHPENITLFGRIFENGVLQQMFPDDFYQNGKLKPEYNKVFEKHKHLLAPVTNPIILAEIEAAKLL